MRDMERDMEIDPQAMMAYIRDMEKKMAAMTRQIASIPPVERPAGPVEHRKIHRPLQSAGLFEPREIHRPLRTSLSPHHEDAKDSITSPQRTTTAPGTSPSSVAGMEAQEDQTELEAEKAALATLHRMDNINKCSFELPKWNLYYSGGKEAVPSI